MTLKFKFQKIGGIPYPILPVTLVNPANGARIDVRALLDCGASRNLFPEIIAQVLGIQDIADTEVGKAQNFGDAQGGKIMGYPHRLIIDLCGAYQFQTVIYFSKNVHADASLPGILGFFDRFVVKLAAHQETIELTPVHPEKINA